MTRSIGIAQTSTAGLLAACLALSAPLSAQSQAGGKEAEGQEYLVPSENHVFVEQIGSNNRAKARQANGASAARIVQQGDENEAIVEQGAAAHEASILQQGDANVADVRQYGAGETELVLAQQGDGNLAAIIQREVDAASTLAEVSQSGVANSVNLVQDGTDNQARLSQEGDGNAMTATQLGASNRLDWTQTGNGLTDLQIEQTGGAELIVVQSHGGG